MILEPSNLVKFSLIFRGKGLTKMKSKYVILAGILILTIILPVFFQSRIFLTMMILAFFYSYLALAWNLIGGFGGQISLGHGIFMGFGSYTVALLFIYLGLTPWIGMFIGAILSAISAYIVGLLTFSFKIQGIFFVVVTLALTEISQVVVKQVKILGTSEGLTLPVSMGWRNYQFAGKNEYYYIILFLLIAVIIISNYIKKSRLGYNLQAIREDEDTAAASGVDLKWNKNLIFIISAILTSIGATFYLQFTFFVDPESTVNYNLNIFLVLCAVIGGLGTIIGPVLGGFFYVFTTELLRFLPLESQQAAAITRILFGLIMMYTMIYNPRGIVGMKIFKKVYEKFI